MRPNDLLILNLREVRRRSEIVWSAIPESRALSRPDPAAMSCLEMVRPVVESPFIYRLMLERGTGVEDDASPLAGAPLRTVREEIADGQTILEELVERVGSYTAEELRTMRVSRPKRGYVREAGDFILRIAYHESVHAGQVLGYLRAMGVDRPSVWD